MAIGMIVILFVGLCVISILGTLLLLLVKSEKAKRKIFYAMSVCGMGSRVLKRCRNSCTRKSKRKDAA